MISDHRQWERCSSDHRRPVFLTEPGSARYSSAPSITTVWPIRLHITTSLKSISQIWWLYHQCSNGVFHQFNFLYVNHVTNHSLFSLVNRLQLIYTAKVSHKYVNVYRHQLLISSKINNGWSMTVTVLQRTASKQQIGLLLVPAIKAAVYINTHSI